jgi:type II secretory pathway pseudopilin PulG
MLLRKEHIVSRTPRRRGGFTLIEAAITTVIIGVGCLAMLQLLGAGTVANGEGTELTTAMNLAGNIRECLTGVAFSDPIPTADDTWGPEVDETTLDHYDDLDDFDGKTFDPPIDTRRDSLGAVYDGWTQSVKVESVKPDDLTTTMAHLTLEPQYRPTSRVTVTIQRHGKTVYTQSWVASYADPSN